MNVQEQKAEGNTSVRPEPVLPQFSINDMAKAGVHLGHRLSARNPKARHYLYGEVGNTHVIDLRKSYYGLQKALTELYEQARKGRRIVFVSTLEKFRDSVVDAAKSSGQHYICKWKGGMLTNWRTTVASIKTLQRYNKILESQREEDEDYVQTYTKKELVSIRKKRDRLFKSFGGISDMDGMPDMIIVLSVHAEKLAVQETRCIGTPVIGIIDTNSDPTLVEYPVAGNDDSLRVVKFYCDLFVETILNGTKEWLDNNGVKSQVFIDSETNLIKLAGSEGKDPSDQNKASGDSSEEGTKRKAEGRQNGGRSTKRGQIGESKTQSGPKRKSAATVGVTAEVANGTEGVENKEGE